MKKIFWTGLLVFLLLGGLTLYRNLRKAVKLDNVTLDVTLLRQDTIDIELNTLVNNLFFFPLEIKDLQYTVSLGKEQLVRDSTAINQEIGDSTRLQVPITIDYKEVLAQLQHLQAQDSTLLDFGFMIRYEVPVLGTRETMIDGTRKIPVPALMDMKIGNIQVESFGFQNIDLDIQIVVENPSSTSASLDNLNFNIRLNESSLAKGMRWQTVLIDPRQQTSFTLPIEITTAALSREFFDKITEGENIKVYLDGSCILRMKDSPLDSVKVYFETEGGMEL